MTKALISVAIIVAFGLTGCSQKAQNETATAANTMSADANATMVKASRDVDAAADKAFGAAENGMNKIGKATNDAKDKAGQALKDTGNEIQD